MLKDSNLRLTSLCFEMYNTWSSKHFFIIFVRWDEYIQKYVLQLNHEANKTILRSSLKLLLAQAFWSFRTRQPPLSAGLLALGLTLGARTSGHPWVLFLLESSFFWVCRQAAKFPHKRKRWCLLVIRTMVKPKAVRG